MGLCDNDQKESGKYAFLSFRNDAQAGINEFWMIFSHAGLSKNKFKKHSLRKSKR